MKNVEKDKQLVEKENTKSIELFLEPTEKHLRLTKPTLELLERTLATIKNCQEEKIECEDYVKLSHSILDTFINQPLEK